MAKALETLRQEHRDMEKLLRALERQLSTFEDGGTPDYEIMEAIVDYSFAYPDLCHHPIEDAIFDMVKQRRPSALNSHVNLETEHGKLAELTRKLASLLSGVVRETPTPREWLEKATRDYVEFTRRHMEMEEEHFFPAAEGALTKEDWRQIEKRLDSQEDPLFSPRVRDRFRRLRDDILAWEGSEQPVQRTNA